MDIARGQRLKLQDLGVADRPFALEVVLGGGQGVDFACFGLDSNRRLSDERYMVFFNQPTSPCGAVSAVGANGFAFDLSRLPASVDALVITAAVDGDGTMASLGPSQARLTAAGAEVASFRFDGGLFNAERAIMLLELYRKDNAWRLNAICQGFNGGLAALVEHFGGTVAAPEAPAAAPPQTSSARLSLEKRIETQAPALVSLVKKAKVSLDKVGLGDHTARVCLCLDISGSMSRFYKSGVVQKFAERILALGCRFDDDGAIDVFLFGANVHHPEPMTLENCSAYVGGLMNRYQLEGDTRYGRAMQAIRDFYFGNVQATGNNQIKQAPSPVYVMFVTDGGTSDQSVTERVVRESSHEPIFWQFMGIGKGRKSKSRALAMFAASDFPFLEKLDELPGRLTDNANYFAVERPDEHSDEALYDLLMDEYPDWIKRARALGMFG